MLVKENLDRQKKNCLSSVYVLLEYYLKRLEEKAVALSFAINVLPKAFKCYENNSNRRFKKEQKSFQFLEILNKRDPSIQCALYLKTIKRE